MNDYQTDEEKVEAIRDWWRENGRAVVAGIVVGIAVVAGWKYWNDYRQSHAEEASDLYASFIVALDARNKDEVEGLIADLRDDYSSTPYPDLALLRLAGVEAVGGEFENAETLLRGLVVGARQAQLRQIAVLRLVRVLVAMGRLDEARTELDQAALPDSWTTLAEELRGDIHRAKGEFGAAHTAYEKAIQASASEPHSNLYLKRDAVGGNL